MADRPSKRARRQISEDSSESSQEESSSKSGSENAPHSRSKAQTSAGARARGASSASTVSRPRRGVGTASTSTNNPSDTVVVSRTPSSSPEDRRRSIKLTVKMPSSKLREVTSQSSVGPSVAVKSRDSFETGEIMTGKRRTRAQDAPKSKRKGRAHDSWDESEGSPDGVDLGGSSANDGSSTTEDESEEDDQDVYDAPTLPAKQGHSLPTSRVAAPTTSKAKSKSAATPALTVTEPTNGAVRSIEEKEMEMEDEEDEELSELESDADEGETNEANVDAEGDEDDMGGEEDAEGLEDVDVDDETDSDEESENSRSGTPKVKTKRQRGQEEGALLALPMEPQIKKVLTADEHRLRRQEMARRRKNLSEKRNEEEKMATINRLLKRQAPKRKGKVMTASNVEAATAAEGASPVDMEELEVERAHPLFTRWISNAEGSRLGVPEEWLDKKVGRLFTAARPSGSMLVEEIA